MKQERIEELLKGTRYSQEGVSLEQIRGIMATNEDALLNAARVQLLAKALQRIANPTESTYGNPQFIALEALRETGLDKESE